MKELIEVIAKALVDNPEAVVVNEFADGDAIKYELIVDPSDIGKIIGRGGKIAKSIRNVVKAAAVLDNKKVTVDIK